MFLPVENATLFFRASHANISFKPGSQMGTISFCRFSISALSTSDTTSFYVTLLFLKRSFLKKKKQ
ncbi:MAG: hypothetical protein B6D35_10040 [Candidatus Brocadia sp. UTAMX2]|nr:MAG: hypothetical protein B6D35_10040 [Candidatus Brocadia sp. UTAMX2]